MLPVEVKAGEVFAKPVGIVGDFSIFARGGDEGADDHAAEVAGVLGKS